MGNTTEIIQANWLNIEDVVIQDDIKNTANNITYQTWRKVEKMLDIYSEQIIESWKRLYKKIGKMGREEAHSIGALHTGAQIWIYNSKWQVLLQKRSMKVRTSRWLFDTSVAWHTESIDETILSGGLREIREEISLSVKPEVLLHIGNYRRETKRWTGKDIKHNNEINKVFLLQYEWGISSLKKQKKEISELKFITLEQLEEDWNDPKTLRLYTSKGEEYRQMILSNIKKILWRNN